MYEGRANADTKKRANALTKERAYKCAYERTNVLTNDKSLDNFFQPRAYSWTPWRMDGRSNGRTDPLIEMRACILKWSGVVGG